MNQWLQLTVFTFQKTFLYEEIALQNFKRSVFVLTSERALFFNHIFFKKFNYLIVYNWFASSTFKTNFH